MFVLNETLEADTFHVADWPLCRVLMMNDATYPWLVLVPMRDGLRDFHNLALEDKPLAMAEIDRASLALSEIHEPDKMNVAALGNMVPQLHIHVIARFATDPAWPGPVWGKVPAKPFDAAAMDATLERLRRAFG